MRGPASFLSLMGFIYDRSTDLLYLADIEDGRSLVAAGRFMSYPADTDANRTCEGVGIQRGVWAIHPAYTHSTSGPFFIPITHESGAIAAICGIGAEPPGRSVALPRDVREFISGSGLRALEVV